MAGVAVGCLVFGVLITLLLVMGWKHRSKISLMSEVTHTREGVTKSSSTPTVTVKAAVECDAQATFLTDNNAYGLLTMPESDINQYEVVA